jgi:hypothetical protein
VAGSLQQPLGRGCVLPRQRLLSYYLGHYLCSTSSDFTAGHTCIGQGQLNVTSWIWSGRRTHRKTITITSYC